MIGLILMGMVAMVTALVTVPWFLALAVPFVLVLCIPMGFPFVLMEVARLGRASWLKNGYAKKLRVLIVDDDAISVLPLIHALSSKVAKLNLVENGQQMIQTLAKDKFDLVFLDQMMPGIEGSEALSIGEKKLTHKGRVPVVFFSNYSKDLHLPEYKKFEIKGIWDKHLPYELLHEKIDSIWNEVNA